MIRKRVTIPEALLTELRSMHQGGAAPEEMIAYLASQKLQKPLAIHALRLAGVMHVAETKSAVHFSVAYAQRRDSDEAFHERVFQSLREVDRSEAA